MKNIFKKYLVENINPRIKYFIYYNDKDFRPLFIKEGATVWKPSQTVVITLDGQCLPSRVSMCYNSLQVSAHNFPTIQCYLCCRFGHTKDKCRSAPRCFRCGNNHGGDACCKILYILELIDK